MLRLIDYWCPDCKMKVRRGVTDSDSKATRKLAKACPSCGRVMTTKSQKVGKKNA